MYMTFEDFLKIVQVCTQGLVDSLKLHDLYDSIFPLTEPCYIAWSNTDKTEGRGSQYPVVISKSFSCVERLGRCTNTQGSDAVIREDILFRAGGEYYGRIKLEYPSQADITNDHILDGRRRAIAKAIELGLSAEEIALISKS